MTQPLIDSSQILFAEQGYRKRPPSRRRELTYLHKTETNYLILTANIVSSVIIAIAYERIHIKYHEIRDSRECKVISDTSLIKPSDCAESEDPRE